MTHDGLLVDWDSIEELVVILKELFPECNVQPDAKSISHFLRRHKLQRLIKETRQKHALAIRGPVL